MSDADRSRGRVLVVADDLTGASDTGVQFAEAGWSAVLQLTPTEPVAGAVTAVTTDSRAMPDDEAQDATRRAVEAQHLGAADRLYLKIDSTLRGSVAAQVRGALEALRATRPDRVVVLCPAYPAMGRTVEAGRLLVHGRSVTESPAGVDPVTPVRTDVVTRIVPGAASIGRADSPEAWAESIEAAAATADVVVVDAVTDDDLAVLAEAIDLIGPRVVPAGSAGLAGPLAERWAAETARDRVPLPGGLCPLFVVSSHHAVAREQVAALVAGLPAAPPGTGPAVLASPDERVGAHLAAELASDLADRAARAMAAEHRFDCVVLVGGDGAEAFLRRVGAQGIAIRGRLLEGVPVGRIVGGTHDGCTVVTKAGGFGDETTLTAVLHRLGTTERTETTS